MIQHLKKTLKERPTKKAQSTSSNYNQTTKEQVKGLKSAIAINPNKNKLNTTNLSPIRNFQSIHRQNQQNIGNYGKTLPQTTD